MPAPRATICYELHKGGQRFAQFAHRCGWVSEWFPVSSRVRTIPCAKCDPPRTKMATQSDIDLRNFYNMK